MYETTKMRTRYLRDAHLHLAEHGRTLSEVDCSAVRSVGECLEAVAARAEATIGHGWVVGRGLRVEALAERRPPTARELHDASGGRAVVVNSFDLHAMAVSSLAMTLGGIERDTPDPPGGLIDRGAGGEPSGWLLEAACRGVRSAMPPVTGQEIREHILTAQRDLLGLGYVEVHELHAKPAMIRELLALDRAGRLELRVWCYATPEHIEGVQALFDEAGRDRRMTATGRVTLDGLKLFTDGTLNARTAWMLEPLADPIPDHPTGTPMMTCDEIKREMQWAFERGYQVAAHAIGDGAVRAMLDVYESLGAPSPRGRTALRIEHAEFIDEADLHRFAQMGVVASLQPCHLLVDIEAIHRLLPHRASRAFVLRDLIDSASASGRDPRQLVWLGSDTPVVSPDPEDNRLASVQRRRVGMGAHEAIAPEQAISEGEWMSLQAASGAD